MAHWTKEQLIKIQRLRPFEFVESEKEVDEYYKLQKYGIAKDSTELKEVIKEGTFPVNNQISNLQKGYYYIIDIKPQIAEFKSQDKTINIAYALYKANKSDTYGNTVYQINVNSLLNGTANSLFENDSITKASDLIGKLIHIVNISEESKSRQATFTETEILMTPEDLAKYDVAPTEEDIATDYLIAQWEFEQEIQPDYESQYEAFEYFEQDMYFD
ncbi:hypothetical protein FACS1894169_13470 [Bacteroidia bacterium]|nr:hypothetical protein FACS1894169_13470 [Bacteroidia bacterium]